jgi:hypothetical protein
MYQIKFSVIGVRIENFTMKVLKPIVVNEYDDDFSVSYTQAKRHVIVMKLDSNNKMVYELSFYPEYFTDYESCNEFMCCELKYLSDPKDIRITHILKDKEDRIITLPLPINLNFLSLNKSELVIKPDYHREPVIKEQLEFDNHLFKYSSDKYNSGFFLKSKFMQRTHT